MGIGREPPWSRLNNGSTCCLKVERRSFLEEVPYNGTVQVGPLIMNEEDSTFPCKC